MYSLSLRCVSCLLGRMNVGMVVMMMAVLGCGLTDAQVAVRKEYDAIPLIVGQPHTILYHVQNYEPEPIRNISLVDISFTRPKFNLTILDFPIKIDCVKGNSTVVYELKVTALAPGRFSDRPALVKYSRLRDNPTGAPPTYESMTVISTAKGSLQAVTKEDFTAFYIPHQREWIVFLSFCLIIVLVPSVLYQRALQVSRRLMLKVN